MIKVMDTAPVRVGLSDTLVAVAGPAITLPDPGFVAADRRRRPQDIEAWLDSAFARIQHPTLAERALADELVNRMREGIGAPMTLFTTGIDATLSIQGAQPCNEGEEATVRPWHLRGNAVERRCLTCGTHFYRGFPPPESACCHGPDETAVDLSDECAPREERDLAIERVTQADVALFVGFDDLDAWIAPILDTADDTRTTTILVAENPEPGFARRFTHTVATDDLGKATSAVLHLDTVRPHASV